MAYLPDLRKQALEFIAGGGKKTEAARRFSVSRATLYNWLADEDPMTIHKTGPKRLRVIDEEVLKKHIADFPDLTPKERAEQFGIPLSSIKYGIQKFGNMREE